MHDRFQIKICGLTRPDEAGYCAELGAHAIGCVFFQKSPRNVTPKQARDIRQALPDQTRLVGVFVNESFSNIMRIAESAGLTTIQLHGQESPELVQQLVKEKFSVVKVLFDGKTPEFDTISHYDAPAYLVECGKGTLPGGNAMTWDWAKAMPLCKRYPLALAGGLSPENAAEAIQAALPSAVDVSSGVEKEPGRKDLKKVKAFIQSVTTCVQSIKEPLSTTAVF